MPLRRGVGRGRPGGGGPGDLRGRLGVLRHLGGRPPGGVWGVADGGGERVRGGV